MTMHQTSDLRSVLADLGIQIKSDYVGPSDDPSFKGADKWSVTLSLGKRRLTTPYFMGSANHGKEPDAASVVYSLISDADSVRDRSFEEFCGDLGYDEDSRTAERVYNACVKMLPRIEALLGPHYEAVAEAAREF
jgi:hypothetical protein